MSTIIFPYTYIPTSDKGKPIADGEIFIGEPGLDPAVSANRIDVYGQESDGTLTLLTQPIATSAGGVPIGCCGEVILVINQDRYSIRVLNKSAETEYYQEQAQGQVTDTGTGFFDTLGDAMAADGALGDFLTTYEYSAGTGVGGGKYEIVAADPGNNLINPAKTDGSGYYLELVNWPVNVYHAGTPSDGVSDASIGIQAWFDFLNGAGDHNLDAGTYQLDSQVTFTGAADATATVNAYGVIFKTSGAISGLYITGGGPNGRPVVKGLTIDHRGNASATCGFDIVRTFKATLEHCTVEANGVNATYGAFRLRNEDPDNSDTGSFWTSLKNCWIRKRSAADVGDIPNGVIFYGASNATVIDNVGFNNCTDGILHTFDPNETVPTVVANSLFFTHNNFEFCDVGYRFVGAAATNIAGVFFQNNRFERVDTMSYVFEGSIASTTPVQPVMIESNYYTQGSVAGYIDNQLGIIINNRDTSGGSLVVDSPSNFEGQYGVSVRTINSSEDALTLEVTGANRGIKLNSSTTDVLNIIFDNATYSDPTSCRIQGRGTIGMQSGFHAGDYVRVENRSGASSWSSGALQIGDATFWVDASGNFRGKQSKPANDTDGIIIAALPA